MAEGDRERWNTKWAGQGVGTTHGSALIDLIGDRLPASGRALDIAGGGSGDGLELARRGLEVTVVDVSDLGLAAATARAEAAGFELTTVVADLDVDPLPPGPWDLVTVANFLDRDLLGRIGDHLAPHGLLAVTIATVTNLERHDRPGARFLLDRGELLDLVGELEIVHHSEDWRPNGRHEAHLLATPRS